TLLNWSQVSVQASPGCLNTSTHSQGDQKPSYIKLGGQKKREASDLGHSEIKNKNEVLRRKI
ncbi:hypothetical protein, partial [Hwanghaeella sp. 1Z406]|uniref:hypothetical protein n=1 Tax=Hwanghaeella sp. 1Z406 TaxID=3402811 RepID=UPI003B680ACB